MRLFDLNTHEVLAEFALADVSNPHVQRKLGMRSWATLTVNTQNVLNFKVGTMEWTLKRPIPWSEINRFGKLVAGKLKTDAAVAWFDNLVLFPNALVVENGQALELSPDVTATVDAGGNITATCGRNLAAKAASGAVFGPIGLLVAGNAKDRVLETRELYLLVDGPHWTYSRAVSPARGGELRAFAQAIGLAARQLGPTTASPASVGPTGSGSSIGEELERLIALRDGGELTTSEFDRLKNRLVDS